MVVKSGSCSSMFPFGTRGIISIKWTKDNWESPWEKPSVPFFVLVLIWKIRSILVKHAAAPLQHQISVFFIFFCGFWTETNSRCFPIFIRRLNCYGIIRTDRKCFLSTVGQDGVRLQKWNGSDPATVEGGHVLSWNVLKSRMLCVQVLHDGLPAAGLWVRRGADLPRVGGNLVGAAQLLGTGTAHLAGLQTQSLVLQIAHKASTKTWVYRLCRHSLNRAQAAVSRTGSVKLKKPYRASYLYMQKPLELVPHTGRNCQRTPLQGYFACICGRSFDKKDRAGWTGNASDRPCPPTRLRCWLISVRTSTLYCLLAWMQIPGFRLSCICYHPLFFFFFFAPQVLFAIRTQINAG